MGTVTVRKKKSLSIGVCLVLAIAFNPMVLAVHAKSGVKGSKNSLGKEYGKKKKSELEVKVINGPDMPVPVVENKIPFVTSCIVEFVGTGFSSECDFDPQPPTDALFTIQYINLSVVDMQNAEVDYTTTLESAPDGVTIFRLPFMAETINPTVSQSVTITEPILTFHDGSGPSLSCSSSRDVFNQGGEGSVACRVTGYLTGPS